MGLRFSVSLLLLQGSYPNGNNSLLGLEIQARILGGAAVVVDQVGTEGVLDLDKVGLIVRGRQRFRKLLKRRAQTIIGLVA